MINYGHSINNFIKIDNLKINSYRNFYFLKILLKKHLYYKIIPHNWMAFLSQSGDDLLILKTVIF